MAKRQIINGGFQDALGNPLNGGTLKMRLTTDAKAGVTGPQVCAGIIFSFTLGATGSVAATGAVIWPNDQLTPTTTAYVATASTASGIQGWKNQIVVPSGTGPFDLNTLVPN